MTDNMHVVDANTLIYGEDFICTWREFIDVNAESMSPQEFTEIKQALESTGIVLLSGGAAGDINIALCETPKELDSGI